MDCADHLCRGRPVRAVPSDILWQSRWEFLRVIDEKILDTVCVRYSSLTDGEHLSGAFFVQQFIYSLWDGRCTGGRIQKNNDWYLKKAWRDMGETWSWWMPLRRSISEIKRGTWRRGSLLRRTGMNSDLTGIKLWFDRKKEEKEMTNQREDSWKGRQGGHYSRHRFGPYHRPHYKNSDCYEKRADHSDHNIGTGRQGLCVHHPLQKGGYLWIILNLHFIIKKPIFPSPIPPRRDLRFRGDAAGRLRKRDLKM